MTEFEILLVNALQDLASAATRIADSIEPKKSPPPRAKPQQAEIPVEAALVVIPCLHGKTFEATPSFVRVLEDAYPGVDVVQTLKEIRAWAEANESLRWTLTGARRGINRWIAGEQNKAAAVARREINGFTRRPWR